MEASFKFKKMKKVLFVFTIAIIALVFMFGCQDGKEPEPTYNDDLGGTEWKWIHDTSSSYAILTFISESKVKCKKNYFGIVGTFTYDYSYSDKYKKGKIMEWNEDPYCEFTISGNCLTFENRKFYKL